MKVSGFTFIKNALIYDYPIVESIQSILPLCDEVIVAVGRSTDATLDLIKSIPSPKIKVIETEWDESLREGGRVLAVETDKAFRAIAPEADWAFYIQGDEILHEQDYEAIKTAMHDSLNDLNVEGLLFNYLHFYGSYDYVGESYRWYRKEIRIVRRGLDIFSYKDAQGFRKKPNDKLLVKQINATVYHYGWVKDPRKMQKKQLEFNKLWRDDQWIENNIAKGEEFDYTQVDSLMVFSGTHPAVMRLRISQKNWKFNFDISRNRYKRKEILKRLIEKLTGIRIGEYRNYRLL